MYPNKSYLFQGLVVTQALKRGVLSLQTRIGKCAGVVLGWEWIVGCCRDSIVLRRLTAGTEA